MISYLGVGLEYSERPNSIKYVKLYLKKIKLSCSFSRLRNCIHKNNPTRVIKTHKRQSSKT